MKFEDAEEVAAKCKLFRSLELELKRLDQQDAATEFPSCGIGSASHMEIGPRLSPAAARSIRELMRQDFFAQRDAIRAELKVLDIETVAAA